MLSELRTSGGLAKPLRNNVLVTIAAMFNDWPLANMSHDTTSIAICKVLCAIYNNLTQHVHECTLEKYIHIYVYKLLNLNA